MHGIRPRDRSAVADAELDRVSLRRVWQFAGKYRSQIFGFMIIATIQAALGLVPPILFGEIIDSAIPDKDQTLLIVFAALILGSAVVAGVLGIVERYLSSRIGEGLIFDLRVALYDHVQRLPLSFFTRTQTGTLTNRLNNDVIGAQRALTSTLGTVVSNVITLSTTLVAMFVLEWRLTLLALLLAPLFLLPYRWVGRSHTLLTKDSLDLNAKMNSTITERFNVAGALLVKLFGRSDDELAQFTNNADQVRSIGVRSALFTRSYMTMLSLLGSAGTAMVYGLGGYFAIQGTFTTGELATMGLLVGRIYLPLTSLSNARIDVLTAFVSFDRVFEVLDAVNPLVDSPDAQELVSPKGKITFANVSFKYPGPDDLIIPSLEDTEAATGSGEEQFVFKNLDLEVSPGELVALVGPSGAGKTTLTSLILRLYDVTDGSVMVDDSDVRDLTQASLRGAIGAVTQDPHLFHDTIKENLLYANPKASDADLVKACQAANIMELVDSMPSGFETLVGERGYRLSGGEKQRLSIARMLLKDPKIVILDEATSHLDTRNEAAVQKAISSALQGRTAVVIAHRLSTVTDADKILVFNDGALVQQGKHEELLAQPGIYSDLYEELVN